MGDKLSGLHQSSFIPVISQIFVTLRVLTEEHEKKLDCEDFEINLCPVVTSRISSNVVSVAERTLFNKWVQFSTEEEEKTTIQYFYEKYNFLGIIGVIDSEHINIASCDKPPYCNSAGQYSINTMMVETQL